MYELKEKTPEEIAAESLIRVSNRTKETARFFGPADEDIMVYFEDRGMLRLSEGDIYRETYQEPGTAVNPPSISMHLYFFDENHRGTNKAIVSGIWGPEHLSRGERLTYRGGLELLPEGLVEDALALLDGTGGIELDYEEPNWS